VTSPLRVLDERLDGASPGVVRQTVQVVSFLAIWGLMTHGTFAGSGDEPHYLVIAQSLAFDGDVKVANNYAQPDNLIGAGQLEVGAHAVPGRDGTLRPVHDIGLPLLFAPYVRLAQHLTTWARASVPAEWLARARLNPPLLFRHLISFGIMVVAALLAGELFAAFLAVSGRPAASAAWALLLAVSPPLASFSFLFFSEIVSALIVLWVFRRLMLHDEMTTAGWWFLGCAIGYLSLLHARNLGLVPVLAGLGVARLLRPTVRPSRIAWLGTGVALGLGLRTIVNYRFWGSLVTNPHARLGAADSVGGFVREVVTRLCGWAFDQEFGLLVYAPIYLLAIPGLFLLNRANPRLARGIGITAMAYVGLMALPLTNVHGWTAGWSPAGRFLVPVVPLLALGVFAAATSGRAARLVTLLATVQVAVAAIIWSHPKLLWNSGDGSAQLLVWLGSARLAWWFPSLLADRSPARVLIASGVAGLVGFSLLRSTTRRRA
jgi:hypothetical protein